MMITVNDIARRAVGDFQAVQKPAELQQMLEWLQIIKPKFIVEVGSYRGGTLWAMKQIFPDATIIGIDNGRDVRPADYHRLHRDHLVARKNDTTTRSYLVNEYGIPDFVFVDGDHSYVGVLRDYHMWRDNCRYIGFHDILPHQEKRIEVWKFWANHKRKESLEFIAEPRDWGGIGIL